MSTSCQRWWGGWRWRKTWLFYFQPGRQRNERFEKCFLKKYSYFCCFVCNVWWSWGGWYWRNFFEKIQIFFYILNDHLSRINLFALMNKLKSKVWSSKNRRFYLFFVYLFVHVMMMMMMDDEVKSEKKQQNVQDFYNKFNKIFKCFYSIWIHLF